MNTLRDVKVGVILVLATLLVAGCSIPGTLPSASPTPTSSASTSPTPTTTTATPTGPYGGIRVGLGSIGEQSFVPFAQSRTDSMALKFQMYDSLFGMRKGTELAPQIAERWEMAPDGLSWIFYIRKGIKFHNGDELTAKDVKFSLDGYSSPVATLANLRLATDRVEIVNDYAVRAYTKARNPYYPYLLTVSTPSLGMVLPKAYTERVGTEYFGQHPIGAGPFRFIRSVSGDNVQYEAVAEHYRVVPAFKTLTVVLIPEEATRVAAVKTGEVDVIDVGLDASVLLEKAGLRTYVQEFNAAYVVLHGAYDPRTPAGAAIKDIRVRQALSLAINRDDIMKNFFYGKALPPSLPALTLTEVNVDHAYWQKDPMGISKYDPEKAKQLLKEAGYSKAPIKLYSFPLGGGAFLPKLGEVIAGYWTNVGINVELTPIDFAVWYSVRVAAKSSALFGAATMFRAASTPDPFFNWNGPFHSYTNWDLLGGSNTELDSLLDAGASTMDLGKAKEIMAKAATIIGNSYTLLSICEVPNMAAVGPKVDIDFPVPSFSISGYVEIAKHRKQ